MTSNSRLLVLFGLTQQGCHFQGHTPRPHQVKQGFSRQSRHLVYKDFSQKREGIWFVALRDLTPPGGIHTHIHCDCDVDRNRRIAAYGISASQRSMQNVAERGSAFTRQYHTVILIENNTSRSRLGAAITS